MDPIAQTSSPFQFSLTAIRSDSIDLRLRLIDASTGRPIVLTGWSGEAKVWASINADVPLHSLEVEVDQSGASTSGTGMLSIKAAPGATLLWRVDGFWSLTLLSSTVRKTIASGQWRMFGPGMAGPGFACGLCSVPAPDQIGGSCVVARDGYQELRLPYPQSVCAC